MREILKPNLSQIATALLFLATSCLSVQQASGQEQNPPDEKTVQTWAAPDPPDHDLCHKAFVRFWRLRIDGKTGDWHLYHAEDKQFLAEMAGRIVSGQYAGAKIEWFALEGKLPK